MGPDMIPAFQIIVGGEDATGAIADRLLSLSITDEDGEKADRLELQIDDRDGAAAYPDMDAELEVSLGFLQSGLSFMGKFKVDGVSGEGPRQTLRITATAADMKGDIRSPKTRAFENKTLADIVATIAGEAGLQPLTSESLSSTFYAFVAQTSESNLHFLTRLAKPLDATAKPAGGALIVQRRGEGKTAAGDVLIAPSLGPSTLSRWSWSQDSRETYARVEAEWSDTAAGAIRKVTMGQGTPLRKLRHVFGSESEATQAADATLRGAGRAAMSISAELAGFDAGLLAGATVVLAGMPRAELNGEWQLGTVTHRLTGAGLVTGFKCRKGRWS
jgi:phage protein D